MIQLNFRALLPPSLLLAALALPGAAQWSFEDLPTPRQLICMTTAHGKVYFAGGKDSNVDFYDLVEVYDENTGAWSSLTLPGPMRWGHAATIGDSVFFGGHVAGLGSSAYVVTGEVFEYDTVAGTWTTHLLSEARYKTALAAVGQYLVVAGGYNTAGFESDRVDVYDTVSATWTTLGLPTAVYDARPAVVGDRLLVVGGLNASSLIVPAVQYVEPATGTVGSLQDLSMERRVMGVGAVGLQAWFVGGMDNSFSPTDRYDLYDHTTGAQTFGTLPTTMMNCGAAVAGNRLIVGGGADASFTVLSKVLVIEVDGTISETNFPAPPGSFPAETAFFNPSACSTARSAYFAGGVNTAFAEQSRVLIYTHPDELVVDVGSLSLSLGGTATFDLQRDAANAGNLYLLLGSYTGIIPGFNFGGVTIPLNLDSYTDLTIKIPNSPQFVNTLGVLDATGAAEAQLVLPPGLSPAATGLTLFHAAVEFSLGPVPAIANVSNVASVKLAP